jgi:DNA-binding NtrC family response regulator
MSVKRAILIVDDEAILLLSIRQALKLKLDGDYVYETAMSSEEGLLVLDRLADEGMEVDLVISDWLMPGMRGDEFLRRVRETRPGTKLVMMSGHAEREEMEELAEKAGLFAFITKPYASANLLDIVHRALGT